VLVLIIGSRGCDGASFGVAVDCQEGSSFGPAGGVRASGGLAKHRRYLVPVQVADQTRVRDAIERCYSRDWMHIALLCEFDLPSKPESRFQNFFSRLCSRARGVNRCGRNGHSGRA